MSSKKEHLSEVSSSGSWLIREMRARMSGNRRGGASFADRSKTQPNSATHALIRHEYTRSSDLTLLICFMVPEVPVSKWLHRGGFLWNQYNSVFDFIKL